MRPELKYPDSLMRAAKYNENKVEEGKAKLLMAANYLKNPDELSFKEKHDRIKDLVDLSTAEKRLIHLSLNFHPSEEARMTPDFLKKMSEEFMQKMGFGNQPYLVYQHFDAGHPHVHILSSLIREDGTRIDTHNQAKNFSEPIRKEMEAKYGLVPADKKENAQTKEQSLKVTAQKLQYGKSSTVRSITNVLEHVLPRYKYSSLQELNTVLREFNVEADRGNEESRVYKNRGLYYRALNDDGTKAGKQIKASRIYFQPTLDYLENKFKENEVHRGANKRAVKTKIEWQLNQQPKSMEAFKEGLEKERISLVTHRTKQGNVFGLTFIDHEHGAIFKGSDIDKDYSAKKILERLGMQQKPELETQQHPKKENAREEVANNKTVEKATKTPVRQDEYSTTTNTKDNHSGRSFQYKQEEKYSDNKGNDLTKDIGKNVGNMVKEAIEPEQDNQSLDYELREEQRRRKRRNQDLER
ncbi:relaxase/mobilization nuclease domain-containing protein [Filimonas effusa]|uniref:Relaxase n=1 Tax=Filimonas effusa TaxID=2508721 RepID=A0A4Q1DC20_9BACT|nr:relaxase/mobilization nuclease domain-containing protein [Filimonas effusa]RXK87021.1 relaxase [Filimonas effusa]